MRAHSLVTARLIAGVLFSVSFVACGSKPDPSLFTTSGALGGDANAGSGGGEPSGSTSAGGASPSAGAATAGDPGAAGSTTELGGASGSTGNGGADTANGGTGDSPQSAGGGNGGSSAGFGEGGGAGQTGSSECAVHGPAATFFSGTQHCYLVVHDLATYSDAKAHCMTLGAHLVTLAGAAEDAFVWSLSPAEHWIGSSDGKGAKEPNPGTYSWVTGEPFEFTNWSSAQPNASKTDCGTSNGGGSCYEHCAFQWTGGEHDGQWNDRYCMHTIQAVCDETTPRSATDVHRSRRAVCRVRVLAARGTAAVRPQPSAYRRSGA